MCLYFLVPTTCKGLLQEAGELEVGSQFDFTGQRVSCDGTMSQRTVFERKMEEL